MIMDYNRTVKDLNGLSKDEFLEKVAECFEVNEEDGAVRPQKKGEVGMYLDKQRSRLIAKPELFEGKDAVGSLDVSVLQDYLLGPVLGIGDPRTDSRIDFIGGIRGLKELEPIKITLSKKRQLQQRIGVPPELVKDYTVTLWRGEQKMAEQKVTENDQRQNVVTFEPTECDKVTITIHTTNGEKDVHIYEVRVYS